MQSVPAQADALFTELEIMHEKKVHAREMLGTLDDFIFILTTSPSMS